MLKAIMYSDAGKSVEVRKLIISLVEPGSGSKELMAALKGERITAFIIKISIRKASVRFQKDACASTTLIFGKFNFIEEVNSWLVYKVLGILDHNSYKLISFFLLL
jgi:hypothetical protein